MRIASDWHMIVGSELGNWTKPVKITFSRSNKDGGGSLTMEVYEGRAAEIQYLIPDMIERIAVYFGYRLVEQIKMKQVSMAIQPVNNQPERRLGAEEQEKINNMLAGIKDDGLNSALKSFLTTIYKKDGK